MYLLQADVFKGPVPHTDMSSVDSLYWIHFAYTAKVKYGTHAKCGVGKSKNRHPSMCR